MSLILAFVYWVLIPALAVLATWWLWRLASTPLSKGLVVAVSAAGFLGLLWLAEGEKWLLDRQVRELCAKDGGIRVYETVKLPAEKFNQWGQPNFYRPTQGQNALGSEYVFKEERNYYRRGNPEMSRYHIQVIRRTDGILLGESISYGRGGGDLPGPWHDSSFHCPEEYGDIPLLVRVFVQSNKG
jgi:hypothetical protein